MPPEPPQPPEPPTVVEKAHGQADLEDVDGDSLTELQLKHVEADVSYRPFDASFRMMLSDNSLRWVSVSCMFSLVARVTHSPSVFISLFVCYALRCYQYEMNKLDHPPAQL